MKVAGFTIVRNAVKYDYPIVEAITSVLPLCDEFIVAVGNSEDNTLDLIQAINSPKIRIIHTIWDDTLREGGRVLAVETDKAFQAISPEVDWCFYIQADEVVHEKYHTNILQAMTKHKENKEIDGLLFHYKHFYGSYDYVGESWNWYRNEIRIIRNITSFFSYSDAQGFRKKPNVKLNVKIIDAFIYHYGWVKHPKDMQSKERSFNRLWHDDDWVEKIIGSSDKSYDYNDVESLELFLESHPAVMKARIDKKDWVFNFDVTKKNYSLKEKIKRLIGLRIGEYKNYKIL
ncbi:MAG: glycosyltransferase family 2 protein [Cyclobacteriaceae bacterium]|nr:glycosyltransferase family 2 protein [Cyclobacteriaceae bacterium]